MNIKDFEIESKSVGTVENSRKQLDELLECGEFSQEDYNYQMEQLKPFSGNLFVAWGERKEVSNKLLDNIGMIIYEGNTGKVVDFQGYV